MRATNPSLISLLGATLLAMALPVFADYPLPLRSRRYDATSAQQRELNRLQGTWMYYGTERGGVTAPAPQEGNQFIFEGHRWWRYVGGQPVQAGTIDIVGVDREFTRADVTITAGSLRGSTLGVLFRIDGDTLQYCYGAPDGARPRQLASWWDRGIRNDVWTRVR